LKGFLKDRPEEGTKQQEVLGGLLSKTFCGVFSAKQTAGQKVSNDHHKKHLQTNSPIIKGGLAKDYQETEKWLKDHAGDWLEKAKNFCEENIQAEDFLDLFKENLEILKGFLIFLSKERCINQALEKNLGKIKQGLQSDYKDGKKWLLEEKNLKLWLEKAKQCFRENIQAEDFLDLFKENLEILKGFLVFLSKEKDDNQELQDQLEKLQGGKEGIFRQENRIQCAQETSRAILAHLDDENGFIWCNFYELSDKSYCMAYIDITGFVQAPVSIVHFYHPKDGFVNKDNTNILVMVFGKDSPDSLKIFSKKASPWLGQDVLQELENQISKLSFEDKNTIHWEKQKIEGDRMCEKFFWKKIN
jgi:hypothetical protein